ncbi:MAG TPA: nucleotidyltransferase domain-containing protein [Salinarimonas sp.]|nr:nucleotidyltransferase domain-containing protein [Salinarimonas sp.]
MTVDDVRRLLEPDRDALRARGVAAVTVLGSVARGEADEASDVDILLDVAPDARFTIVDLVGARYDLRDRLGRAADVHLREGIHYRIRDQVLADAVRVP